jgi:hypothetical protein
VLCGETRGPVVTVRALPTFEAMLTAERVGIVSVLTPDHAHARRAWTDLNARTVSVNAVFRAARSVEPELLDAATRTKVVHIN